MQHSQNAKVEWLPRADSGGNIVRELDRLFHTLSDWFPYATDIRFEFDGKLQVHTDAQRIEEVALVETQLPNLGAAVFSQIRRGKTPGRAFHHRVTAQVNM